MNDTATAVAKEASAPSQFSSEGKKKHTFGKIELGYAAGSLGHMPTTVISMFYLTFCTYVLGMDPAWMAGLFFVGRIWDGISDPLIGSLPDRRMIGKSGERFKPYMRLFMLPYLLSAIMCFIRVPLAPGSALLYFWVAFAYIASETCNTGVNMSFNAMTSVITDVPSERARLARGKTVASAVAAMALNIIPPLLCFDANSRILPNRVFILAICASVLSFLMYQLFFKWCPERIVYKPQNVKYSYWGAIRSITGNRNLLGMMLVAFALAISSGSSTIKIYFYTEYLKSASIMSLGAVSMPFIIVCIVLLPAIVKKVGTRRVILTTLAVNLLLRVLIAALPIHNALVFVVLETAISLFIMPLGTLNMVLTANAVDYGQWKTGQRNDGATFALYTFAGKVGMAISSAFAALGLSLVGYQPGMNVEQSATTVAGIRWLYVCIPVVGAVLVLVAMVFVYNLDDAKVDAIHEDLRQRRGEQGARVSEEMAESAESMISPD